MDQSQWADPPSTEQEKSSTLHPSALSADAPSFSPAPPPPEASTSDYFSQTGAQDDDLFSGDLEPAPADASMRVRSEDNLFSDDFTPVQQPVVAENTASVEAPIPSAPRARGDIQRGRGRGRGRGNRGGANTQPPKQPSQPNGEAESQPAPSIPGNAPSGPRKETTASVKGDRQATGGIKKPKLTEAELEEKMAAIQIKNASLTAAHARAQADAASFAEREEAAKKAARQEKELAQKREKEERKDRQQMMGERERNRQRKLKAMEGREWDMEKHEDAFGKGGRFDKKGGFVGDREDYTDGREYLYREPRGGQRGGRGRGRRESKEQAVPRQDDFPALPGKGELRATDMSAGAAVKSWADQVESSNA